MQAFHMLSGINRELLCVFGRGSYGRKAGGICKCILFAVDLTVVYLSYLTLSSCLIGGQTALRTVTVESSPTVLSTFTFGCWMGLVPQIEIEI